MDAKALRTSEKPPSGASAPLAALWHIAQGDWQKAHALVDREEGAAAAWVHAHLHRVEGDHGNAAYWYGRAGKSATDAPLGEEWDQIAEALITEGGL